MSPSKQAFLPQLNALLHEYSQMQGRSEHQDLSDLPVSERQTLVTRSISAIGRVAGGSSSYSSEIERILSRLPQMHAHLTSILGVVQALRDDVRDGYVLSLVELAHAEVFGDLLEMAEHLTSSGYKDAAAVIAGSSLEAHLRALCAKHAIDTFEQKADGSQVAKRADRINSELAQVGAYSKLDQKNVTAWLDLRNKAAHGHYAEYSKDQVALLIASVRDFIARAPA